MSAQGKHLSGRSLMCACANKREKFMTPTQGTPGQHISRGSAFIKGGSMLTVNTCEGLCILSFSMLLHRQYRGFASLFMNWLLHFAFALYDCVEPYLFLQGSCFIQSLSWGSSQSLYPRNMTIDPPEYNSGYASTLVYLAMPHIQTSHLSRCHGYNSSPLLIFMRRSRKTPSGEDMG